MKKWQQYLIVLISAIVVIAGTYFFVPSAKSFYEQSLVYPVLKVYSEKCGQTIEQAQQKCDGYAFTVIKKDKKTHYCWGECK